MERSNSAFGGDRCDDDHRQTRLSRDELLRAFWTASDAKPFEGDRRDDAYRQTRWRPPTDAMTPTDRRICRVMSSSEHSRPRLMLSLSRATDAMTPTDRRDDANRQTQWRPRKGASVARFKAEMTSDSNASWTASTPTYWTTKNIYLQTH
jgi:hypothetical protein